MCWCSRELCLSICGWLHFPAQMRTKYGDRWRAVPSATVAKPYWDRVAQLRWVGHSCDQWMGADVVSWCFPGVADSHKSLAVINMWVTGAPLHTHTRPCHQLLVATPACLHSCLPGSAAQLVLGRVLNPYTTHCCAHMLAVHVHRQSLAKAGESDAGVISRMNEHEAGFKDLAIDAAALRMPRLQVCERCERGLGLRCGGYSRPYPAKGWPCCPPTYER
jgi:hypothetical protein